MVLSQTRVFGHFESIKIEFFYTDKAICDRTFFTV